MLSQIGRLNTQVRCLLKLKKSKFLLVSYWLSFSLLANNLYPVFAQKQAPSIVTPGASPSATTLTASSPASNNTLANGVYLYGQSAQPNQIQKEYFVFELQDNQVTGAFYMPRSSFDCFYGHLKAGELHLTITDSYDEVAYPYTVKLQAYKPVASVSVNDQRILRTCKAEH